MLLVNWKWPKLTKNDLKTRYPLTTQKKTYEWRGKIIVLNYNTMNSILKKTVALTCIRCFSIVWTITGAFVSFSSARSVNMLMSGLQLNERSLRDERYSFSTSSAIFHPKEIYQTQETVNGAYGLDSSFPTAQLGKLQIISRLTSWYKRMMD